MIIPCAVPFGNQEGQVSTRQWFEFVQCLVQGTSDNVTATAQNTQNQINTTQSNILGRINANYSALSQTLQTNQSSTNQQLNGVITGLSNLTNNISSTIRNEISNSSNGINSYTGAVAQWLNEQNNTRNNNLGTYVGTVGQWIDDQSRARDDSTSARLTSIYNSLRNQINNINTGSGATVEQVKSAVNQVIYNQTQSLTASLGLLSSNLNSNITNSQDSINRNLDNARSSIVNYISSIITQTNNRINSVRDTINSQANNITRDINDRANLNTAGILNETRNSRNFLEQAINEANIRFENWANENIVTPLHESKDAIDALGNIGEGLLNFTLDDFADIGNEFKDSINSQIELIKDFINKLTSGQFNTWDDFITEWNNISNTQGILFPLLMIVSAPTILNSLARFWTSPFLEHINVLANEEARAALLGVSQILELYQRGEITVEQFGQELAKLGYSDQRIAALAQLIQNPINVTAAREALLRGIITEEYHDTLVMKTGITPELLQIYKQLYFPIPPIPDLIRMMVREVFTPEIAEQYGQFEDYPTEATPLGRMQGVSEEWMKSYWAAHWELPSPTMGFEMFHRSIIDYDDLEKLLKSQDYMPFWRDKLIQLSYNPITRVDIRRMFAVGVYTQEDVYQAYLKIGYSPEDAAKLTDFTIKYETSEETITVRELARTNIEKGVKLGFITREDGIERLMKLNYLREDAELLLDLATYSDTTDLTDKYLTSTTNSIIKEVIDGYKYRLISAEQTREYLTNLNLGDYVIELMISLADFEYEQAFKQQVLSMNREGYMNGTFAYADFRNNLVANGFTAEEINKQQSDLDILKLYRTKGLSMTQYFNAFWAGAFNIDTLIDKLRGMGYSDESIIYLLITEGVPVDG